MRLARLPRRSSAPSLRRALMASAALPLAPSAVLRGRERDAALDPSAPTTTYNLFLRDRDAATTAIERVLPGRLRKGRCTTAARAPRGKRCDRFKAVGTIAAKDLASGPGQLSSSGRFSRKRLPAGRYRITLTATPRTGAAATATTTFTVLKATR